MYKKYILYIAELLLLSVLLIVHTGAYYQSGKSYFPDGKNFYTLQSSEKGEWSFILNGEKKFSGYEGISQIQLIEEGNLFAFVRKEKEKFFRVITNKGEDRNIFHSISHLKIYKEEYAYTGYDGKYHILVVNGEAKEKFESITNLVFEKGELVVIGTIDRKKVWYRNGRIEENRYQNIGNVFSSPSLSRTIIPIKQEDKWFLSENGEILESEKFDLVMNIKFSGDETSFYSTVKSGKYWYIINQDGKIISEDFLYIPKLLVSEKGDTIAYVAFPKEKFRNVLVINGEIIEGAFKIGIIGIDSNGKTSYYTEDKKGNRKYTEK